MKDRYLKVLNSDGLKKSDFYALFNLSVRIGENIKVPNKSYFITIYNLYLWRND